MIGEGTRVAVIDDISRYAVTAAGIAEEAGFAPSIISEEHGPFGHTGQLIERVKDLNCNAVICDHRLSQVPFAAFTGAEFVAELYSMGIPGVLLSTFSAIDSDTSIRLHRARIPSLIGRNDLDPDHILDGLSLCEDELGGRIVPERRPRRTLVRVVDVITEGGAPVVDAILHAWNPAEAIRFPLRIIEDQQIVKTLSMGFDGELRLFAKVNVGCHSESELFFKEFELAPEPDVEDLES